MTPLRAEVERGRARINPTQVSVHTASQAARLLPGLLGAGGTKTYLVILANPSELRPTGGFAGNVGAVTFANGNLTKLDIRNEFDVSAAYKDKFPPPVQEAKFLSFLNDQLEIGDAGWDPDFPTSARLQERMWKSATGQDVDGTISLDPILIASLLKVTGPVDVPPFGSLSAENFYFRLNVIVNVPPDRGGVPQGGKEALPAIAAAISSKVLAQPSNRWPDLATALLEGAQQRHLQVSVKEPAAAAALHDTKFDGSLIATPLTSDYLFICEANVAATKGDYYISRQVDVKVEIYPSGLNRHEVRIHYDYPPSKDPTDTALNVFLTNPTSLYRDYVRFYLPLTATLSNVGYLEDGKAAPAYGGGIREQYLEADRQVFATFFILHRGHNADLVIDYEVGLPADSPYELYVQKQAGLPNLPVKLTVSYPGGVATRGSTIVKDQSFRIDW